MESRIVIPDGMLKAAEDAVTFDASSNGIYLAIEGALRWLSENPIVPTDEQIQAIADYEDRGRAYPENINPYVIGFQRRMFLAPEPEIPEAVKDLLGEQKPPFTVGTYQWANIAESDRRVLEAYRRGKGSK